jgi:hypothetical protein
MSGILAVAFSDVDGLDGYSTGDVLIARLIDTSGNGQPGPGDTVEMGRYPTNLDATSFGDWSVKSHSMASLVDKDSSQVGVETGSGLRFYWRRAPGDREYYYEFIYPFGPLGTITDGWMAAEPDRIEVQAGSPSAPVGNIDPVDAAVATCAAVWNIDFFTPRSGSAATGGPEAQTSGSDLLHSYPIPDLQACQRPDGVLAVFPVWADNPDGDDPDAFCAAVGLQPPYRP